MTNTRRNEPTQDALREVFDYDSERGALVYRKAPPFRPHLLGTHAGYLRPDGYHDTAFKGRSFKTHRLIYIHQVGAIPDKKTIDHIDRDGSNNRIENLRVATRPQQSANRVPRRGFYKHVQGKWHARLRYQRKLYNLGLYKTALTARLAYEKECIATLGEFSPAAYFTEALSNIFAESSAPLNLLTTVPYLFLQND